MMRRTIVAVVACAGLLGWSATAASADVANAAAYVCTGTATWDVNLAGGYADVFVTTGPEPGCKSVDAWVEDNGNPHVNASDWPYSGGFRVDLLGVNVTGNDSFVGAAFRQGMIGFGQVEVVSPNVLNATLHAVPSDPAVTTSQHVGVESCGDDCYLTNVRWVGAWDQMP